jgi:Mn2+/Fe2+ NRAMP family transporter
VYTHAQISYAAHIGGAITGLFLGLVLLRNLKVLKWEQILQWISLAVYACIFLACAMVVIFVAPDKSPLFHCSPNTF